MGFFAPDLLTSPSLALLLLLVCSCGVAAGDSQPGWWKGLGAEASLHPRGRWAQPWGSLQPPSLPIYPLDGRPLCSLWSRQAVLVVLALPAAAFMLSHFLPYLRQTRAVFLQQTSAEGTGLAGKRGRAKGRWHRGAGDGWGAASGPGISQSQKKNHESRGISPGPLHHPLRLLFFSADVRRAGGCSLLLPLTNQTGRL